MVPGLRVLRLEFQKVTDTTPLTPSSVSGDKDADAFHELSERDFSFFAAERPPLPPASMKAGSSRRGSTFSKADAAVSGSAGRRASSAMVRSDGSGPVVGQSREMGELKDVVEELKRFRREPGGWKGELQLLFPESRREF